MTNFFRPVLKLGVYFAFFILMVSTAFSQTSTSVGINGGGTFYYTVTQTTNNCWSGIGTAYFTEYDFSNFSYTGQYGGTITAYLSGSTAHYYDLSPCAPGGTSLPNGPDPTSLDFSVSDGQGKNYILTVIPWNGVMSGSLSAPLPPPPVTGFINPKFVILGVTYAPPGPNSNVTYTNSTFVGNTTTTTGSYTNGTNLTISVTQDIGAWLIGTGIGHKMTNSMSTDYIQGANNSSTVTISKQATVSDMTNGTGNAFFPVNHDYDMIWLWLNPLMIYTIFPDNPTSLQWNGYGYDSHDMNGMDIFGVQVGWLNGHFGNNPSINNVLARSWVTTNEPGMIWPAGEGPGLTPTDIANILQADPFTSGSYTLPSPLPSTTADGRFTQVPYPPNPIEYIQAGLGNGGGLTQAYNTVNTNTQSVGQGTSHTFQQAFGIENEFSGGTWFNHFTINIKTTNTVTMTNTWQSTLTTTHTLTNALSVTGPGCPQTSPPCVPVYTGPGQFIVYQDNMFGTFMFYPR